jgi:hypothetical protein
MIYYLVNLNDMCMVSPLCQLVRCFLLKKKRIEMENNAPTYYNYLSLLLGLNFRRTQTIYTFWEN